MEEVAERLAQTERLVTQLKDMIREKDAALRSKDEQLKVRVGSFPLEAMADLYCHSSRGAEVPFNRETFLFSHTDICVLGNKTSNTQTCFWATS